jgi:hypothetical protein
LLAGPVVGSATLVATQTVRGEGSIIENWINNGTITAEDISGDSAGTLRIGVNVLNNGVIRSSATATLMFGATMTQGATGRIIADANTIQLSNSKYIGGTLETINGGVFQSTGNSLRLDGVRLAGTLQMVNPLPVVGTLAVEANGFTNDGVIELSPDNPGAAITFLASATIGGTGEIIMFRQPGSAIGTQAGVTGTFGAGQTIRGAGRIDGAIVNNGLIIAEPRINNLFILSGAAKTNNNVLRADAGATLRIEATTVTQNAANGRIIANGGAVELGNAPFNAPLIIGGRLETVGASTIEVVSGGARLDNVTNEGTFNVRSGRTLNVGGSSLTNNGTLTLQATTGTLGGAALTFVDDVTVDGTGEIVLSPTLPFIITRININEGLIATQAADHTIRGEGQINGPGTLINNGSVEGTSAANFLEVNSRIGGSGLLKNVRIDGTHSPGESTAIVPLAGAYTIGNFGGRLEIELGGTTPGSGYDQLLSSDPANVITIGTNQTTLKVTLTGGFVPEVGDMFTVISTAGTISGDFAVEILPLAAGGNALSWAVHYNPSNITLEALTSNNLPGDFNFDGKVDAADYVVWRKNGLSLDEFNTWRANFGAMAGSGSGSARTTSSAGVPEPATASTAMLSMLGCLLLRIKRHGAGGSLACRKE